MKTHDELLRANVLYAKLHEKGLTTPSCLSDARVNVRKSFVPSKTKTVGPHLVDVVLNFGWRHPLYLDVGGASYQVLGVLSPADLSISSFATTPRGDFYGAIEVLANGLQNNQKLAIYRVVSTTTGTGELTSLKVWTQSHRRTTLLDS